MASEPPVLAQPPWYRARPATAGLIVVCSVAFLVSVAWMLVRSNAPLGDLLDTLWTFPDGQVLVNVGGLASARVWLDLEWWRVASAGLLHGSWLHLGLNMLGLWAVGQWTEKIWGWWRQLLVFGVSSIGGCLASLAWAEAPLVVGASAGIFGLAGALVIARVWGRDEIRSALAPVSGKTLAFWLVFWLVIGALLPLVFGISLLAQAGHIGGLAFGCALGWMLSGRHKHRYAAWMQGSVIGLCMVGAGIAAAAPSWRAGYHTIIGAELLVREDFEAAAEAFEVGLERAPGDHTLANAVAYSLAEAGVSLERADELVLEAMEGDPGNGDYFDTMGWIRCKQGREEAGLVWVRLGLVLAGREAPEIEGHLLECARVGGSAD